MKMSSLYLLVGLLFLVSCDEDPTTPLTEPGPGIVGQVLDVEGNPAVGAPVGVILGLPPAGIWNWPPDEFGREDNCQSGGHGIIFVVDQTSALTVEVVDHQDLITRTIVEDMIAEPGGHSFLWHKTDDDGNLAPNGIYKFRFTLRRPWVQEESEGGFFLHNELSLDYVDCIGPAAITDAEGRFRIPYDRMPIGLEAFHGWDEPGTIPDSLWIQSAQGIGRVRQALTLTDLENDREITLQMDYLPD